MTATTAKKQLTALLEIVSAVGEVIQTVGRIPSGHLYVQLMGSLTLERYENVIQILIDARMVRRERSHELVWIGPERRVS